MQRISFALLYAVSLVLFVVTIQALSARADDSQSLTLEQMIQILLKDDSKANQEFVNSLTDTLPLQCPAESPLISGE